MNRYAKFLAGLTLFLIFMGGLVKSTGTGLSDPTWPQFNGGYEPQLRGATRFEHAHRLVAGTVALLTLGFALTARRREMRAWVRRLSLCAAAAVLAQATLGGLTVLLKLESLGTSLAHAGLAQLFFGIVTALAVVTAPAWIAAGPAARAPRWLAPLATATAAAVYVQILLGAWVRYTPGAPYAIPDFPLAYGMVLPPLGDYTVRVQFIHRIGAAVVAALTIFTHVVALKTREPLLRRPALLTGALVCVQVLLGGATIWTVKAVLPTTLHVATGAALFAASVALAISAWRVRPAGRPSRMFDDLATLTKARIAALVLIATAAGFYLGSPGPVDVAALLAALAGTALLSAGSAVLNQVLERDADALMRRTADRPIPAGRISARAARALAFGLAGAGLAILLAGTNLRTVALGALTFASYVWIYTPLKRVSWVSTIVGAVPGALPPVMGWAAAADSLGFEAWTLFAILFFWQIPHFFAIAWIYREDYARGGFPMLPVLDIEGGATARQVTLCCLALLPLSLVPAVSGMAGESYLIGALALGTGFLGLGVALAARRTDRSARRLFLASVLYLPALLALLTLDKA